MGVADPDGIVVGNDLFFAGTSSNEDSISIYRIPLSEILQRGTSGANLSSYAPHHYTYNPGDVVNNRHMYCGIAGPDLSLLPNGNILLAFSAHFKANTNVDDSCDIVRSSSAITVFSTTITPPYASQNFSGAHWTSYPHVGIQSTTSSSNSTMNRNYLRLDLPVFLDGNQSWASYTWLNGSGGNLISTFNLNQNTIINNTIPNYTFDEGITEAPAIFKRGSYYYLVYSQNFYNSKYQIYYKKATSVSGLNTGAPSCRLTFNSWETRPNNRESGYNAGHGSIVKINGEPYLIYHYGYGRRLNKDHGWYEPAVRNTYIDKLKFYGSGNIKQIPAPSFVGGGNHLGNLSGCY